MDISTRSLLLQSVNVRKTIPVRRNGCVCLIPIAVSQEQESDNILSDCVRNCMTISRELGGEPTLEECQACCTDCIQSFDNPENCREACILGKGGPGEGAELNRILVETGIDSSLRGIFNGTYWNVIFRINSIMQLVREIYCTFFTDSVSAINLYISVTNSISSSPVLLTILNRRIFDQPDNYAAILCENGDNIAVSLQSMIGNATFILSIRYRDGSVQTIGSKSYPMNRTAETFIPPNLPAMYCRRNNTVELLDVRNFPLINIPTNICQ